MKTVAALLFCWSLSGSAGAQAFAAPSFTPPPGLAPDTPLQAGGRQAFGEALAARQQRNLARQGGATPACAGPPALARAAAPACSQDQLMGNITLGANSMNFAPIVVVIKK